MTGKSSATFSKDLRNNYHSCVNYGGSYNENEKNVTKLNNEGI